MLRGRAEEEAALAPRLHELDGGRAEAGGVGVRDMQHEQHALAARAHGTEHGVDLVVREGGRLVRLGDLALAEEADVGAVEHVLEGPLLVDPRAEVRELLTLGLAPRQPRDDGA